MTIEIESHHLNTAKSFKLAIIELVMLATTLGLTLVVTIFHFAIVSSIIILPMVFACFLSLLGSYYSLKSLREPNTIRKIIAMFIHFSLSSVFVWLIVSNLIEVVSVFGR